MARKKGSGKLSALSEEYIIDSDSDGPVEAKSSSQTIPSNAVEQRNEKSASSKLITLTESPRGDSSVDGEDDVNEVSSSSSGESPHGQEAESGPTTGATPQVQRKKPPKVNGASVYGFGIHLGGES
jgi:hypothetical protein